MMSLINQKLAQQPALWGNSFDFPRKCCGLRLIFQLLDHFLQQHQLPCIIIIASHNTAQSNIWRDGSNLLRGLDFLFPYRLHLMTWDPSWRLISTINVCCGFYLLGFVHINTIKLFYKYAEIKWLTKSSFWYIFTIIELHYRATLQLFGQKLETIIWFTTSICS